MSKRNLWQRAMRRLRVLRWKLFHPNYLAVFNWHQVTPEFDAGRHHPYTWMSLDAFTAEIDYLSAAFHVLPLDEALARLRDNRLTGPSACLTFDDGDISVAEYVAPLLRRRGLPATFFINTAYLDGVRAGWVTVLNYLAGSPCLLPDTALPSELAEKAKQLRQTTNAVFYREVREAVECLASRIPDLRSRLVSPDWLASLDGRQFSIGAHGHEHERFSMMSADWQRKDLQTNVELLSRFPAFKPIFAVPFGRAGDWTEETVRIARELRLTVVLADGGVNVGPRYCYDRIPSDGYRLRPLMADVLAAQSTQHG